MASNVLFTLQSSNIVIIWCKKFEKIIFVCILIYFYPETLQEELGSFYQNL